MGWRNEVSEEWRRRRALDPSGSRYPLGGATFDEREIIEAVDVLLSGQITMSSRVAAFEKRFAEAVGAPHAVMVNSGSSANLLALAALADPLRLRQGRPSLPPGSDVLVPAVCWSTSVWPIVQVGCRPVFVDVDPKTLNVDVEDVRRRITSSTRAIVAVHVLGNCADLGALRKLVLERDLLLVEDTCEALGSKALIPEYGRFDLGTFGNFGTYSFYYSHHITTGEGGMVVCQDEADADRLRSLRAHGWARDGRVERTAKERENPGIDPRFLFVRQGFNVRPTEIQAAFGLIQIERLLEMNVARVHNRAAVVRAVWEHPIWHGQFTFAEASPGVDPAWFGLSMMLVPKYQHRREAFASYLTRFGIENRPIVSGNFLRQPAARERDFGDPKLFPGAEAVHERGIFIGLSPVRMSSERVEWLADAIMSYFKEGW